DCKRPRFAEVARWKRPIGNKQLTGPSIRLAEAAIRAMGNVDVQTPTVYDDDDKRFVRVSVTDLEANATYSVDIPVAKTVERRDGSGRDVIGTRPNSTGQMVYIVRATDDEVAVKQAAMVSKAIRTCALRLVPGDILEEALDACGATLASADKADPEGARKKLLDAFAVLRVTAAMLTKHLGHDTKTLSDAERDDLRTIYAAIRDGEARWADYATAGGGDAAAAPAGGRADAAKQATAKKAALAEVAGCTALPALIALCAAKEQEWTVRLSEQGRLDVTRALDDAAKRLGLTGVDELRERMLAERGEAAAGK
ncbi:MAG: hypothetical protein AABY22_28785, partial [Nanoarchaeota archaeon]